MCICVCAWRVCDTMWEPYVYLYSKSSVCKQTAIFSCCSTKITKCSVGESVSDGARGRDTEWDFHIPLNVVRSRKFTCHRGEQPPSLPLPHTHMTQAHTPNNTQLGWSCDFRVSNDIGYHTRKIHLLLAHRRSPRTHTQTHAHTRSVYGVSMFCVCVMLMHSRTIIKLTKHSFVCSLNVYFPFDSAVLSLWLCRRPFFCAVSFAWFAHTFTFDYTHDMEPNSIGSDVKKLFWLCQRWQLWQLW